MKKITAILLLFVIAPFFSIAQDWHVGGLLGISNYNGDLVEKRVDFRYTGPAIGLLARKDINRYLTLRGGFTFGIISAADSTNENKNLVARNLSFKSNVFELSVLGELNFLDIEAKGFTPYIFAGVAGFGFDPTAKDLQGNRISLRSLGTEGQGLPQYPDRQAYNLIQVAIPFGAGIKVLLNDSWTLGLEVGIRKTFTDYLDDVSTTYVDENTLLAMRGQKAVDMAYRGDEVTGKGQIPGTYPLDGTVRGNPDNKDWYMFSGLTITYRLSSGSSGGWGRQKASRCPVFK
ncbi:DUF6089 family protein [Chitinophaga defluvii]|uniref:DUF6089 family protein n=1 Tax=Chitinophaga defluvii TaxID=3163343 RepID=A0ABV2T3Q9_9BACT